MFRQTNSVQSFLRTASFLITFAILAFLTLVPLTAFMAVGATFSVVLFFIFLMFDLWLASLVSKMFYVLPEWDRLVLLRLGKFFGVKGPGFFIISPFIYSVADIIDTRIITYKVEATATLTQDNVPTKVTAAIEFEVEDPKKAVIGVKNYLNSVVWLSTEALKNTIGSLDLKELLSNRDEIALQLKTQIDEAAAGYGLNVRAVRITDVDTPQQLVEELAVIARARRAAQAKQIQAEAEILVAEKMAQASKILADQEGGFRLREIQNLAEMSKEESAMIIIYPQNSSRGKDLANAAISQFKKKRPSDKNSDKKPKIINIPS